MFFLSLSLFLFLFLINIYSFSLRVSSPLPHPDISFLECLSSRALIFIAEVDRTSRATKLLMPRPTNSALRSDVSAHFGFAVRSIGADLGEEQSTISVATVSAPPENTVSAYFNHGAFSPQPEVLTTTVPITATIPTFPGTNVPVNPGSAPTGTDARQSPKTPFTDFITLAFLVFIIGVVCYVVGFRIPSHPSSTKLHATGQCRD
jgi:hypothetical protein